MSPVEVRQAQWLRGVLDLAVLALLAESGESYGYLISQQLAESGLGEVKGGTLYPLLNRLEEAGLLNSAWRAGDGGPGRKFYEISGGGRRLLAEHAPQWTAFAGAATTVVQRGMREAALSG
ncbi:PadR family transcriptional regulator [Crossiella cryophila]|uniref:PadR family transcriptional regulator PadR n=1 Tax=Crossiella cryophila TaxID=43355 RepID=A0A7W7FUE2_9PSEU|nr:PadR family transcriptional regulator [Crossiella cryophila]MBB4675699.1 PadR family transcriptional regulator PadR [Crossiella cryophila]